MTTLRRQIRKLTRKRDRKRSDARRLDDHDREIRKLWSEVRRLRGLVVGAAIVRGAYDALQPDGDFQLHTKLQDSSWEFWKAGTLDELKREVKKARKGPLGTSCMYQIVDRNSKVVFQK